MEAGDVEGALKAVESSISRIKWRLRPSARRRLDTDILALCTGLRPVVMVDYGGKMPELKDHLCMLMHHCHEESIILQHLRVMVIEDMIYLIHVKGLAEHALFTPPSQSQLLFVDLEQDPPKMLSFTEENMLISGLLSMQKLFLSVLPLDEVNKSLTSSVVPPLTSSEETSTCKHDDPSCAGEHIFLQSSEFINLSSCMQDTNVTIPTLNGWLLGYPVVYLFSKEHISDAVYNLSTKALHLYKIIVCRKRASGKKCEEELMSLKILFERKRCGHIEFDDQKLIGERKVQQGHGTFPSNVDAGTKPNIGTVLALLETRPGSSVVYYNLKLHGYIFSSGLISDISVGDYCIHMYGYFKPSG